MKCLRIKRRLKVNTKNKNNSSLAGVSHDLVNVSHDLASVNHDLMASNSRDYYDKAKGKVTRIYNDYYYGTEYNDSSNSFVKAMIGILVGVVILTIASALGLCGSC